MCFDSRLFLWRVGAMQDEALAVIKAWGFTLKAELVWIKTTLAGAPLIIDEDGKPMTAADFKPHRVPMLSRDISKSPRLNNLHFGMGFQVRYAHEVCLIATRGNPERTAHIRSVFFAPVPRVPKTAGPRAIVEHSEKPPLFYKLVEQMSPGPYFEMFSRKRRANWTCDGNELAQAA